jgi:formate--tetrahydrofolate ligase
VKSDIEIARASSMKPIIEIASKIGIPQESVFNYGHYKAKVSLDFIKTLEQKPDGKLILVTAMTPTPAGEGKTTTTVGLGDALNAIGKKTIICLREPSLGPCFGMKGGAAGGGFSQVVPMEDINLHFTGDFHAIGAAHNLLSALIDNHIYWGNELGIDVRRITWKRVLDMNDRSLREIVTSLGGPGNGYPRETGFYITVASEVMAILCLANNLEDLERRLSNIVIGYTRDKKAITAKQLEAHGAMTVLLKDAMMPNIVQTLESSPAFVHGGPFANIAHGCNSIMATKTALKLSDFVVTEAGFGADLGAEKFFNIKCRKSGLVPSVAVVVVTVRALKMHGGVSKENLGNENIEALKNGLENLGRHLINIDQFGVPTVVAINQFTGDTESEFNEIKKYCENLGVKVIICTHWSTGSKGTTELAMEVVKLTGDKTNQFRTLYENSMTLWDKTSLIAKSMYGAKEIVADKKIREQFKNLQESGYGEFPICMAKTQYSFSSDPNLKGAPTGHTVPINEVRLAAGAEFIVVVAGEIMTMPGLPRVPSANSIALNSRNEITGLF